ncbi:MAG: radical SAM protein [Spirochaetia bacterium]
MAFYNTENWPEKSRYYRFPWSNNDNPISWLEITDVCNIYCKGCYRKNLDGHRDLDVLKKEVDFFKRVRNTDGISIAGGEPLVYPKIVELVEYISNRGIKPVIISNTYALNREILTDLYNAGLYGITCHIDMLQDRPDVPEGSTELDIMNLRQQKADLLYDVTRGNINVVMNSTVYHENFQYLPDIVKWARKNVKKVHGLVFICYRGVPVKEGVTWDVSGDSEGIAENIQYTESDASQIDITSVDIYNLLKDNFSDTYEPAAYLGGTGHIKDYKWWAAAQIMEGNGKTYGCIGPKTMEYLQTRSHWKKGTYFAYLNRNRVPRAALQVTGMIGDRAMKPVRKKMFRRLLNPLSWFQPVYIQTIGLVQAPDMMDNGMPSMCESCPDMCVWEDNLVNSCRLDEYRKYGRLMNAIVHTDKEDSMQADNEAVKAD